MSQDRFVDESEAEELGRRGEMGGVAQHGAERGTRPVADLELGTVGEGEWTDCLAAGTHCGGNCLLGISKFLGKERLKDGIGY